MTGVFSRGPGVILDLASSCSKGVEAFKLLVCLKKKKEIRTPHPGPPPDGKGKMVLLAFFGQRINKNICIIAIGPWTKECSQAPIVRFHDCCITRGLRGS